MQIRNRKAIYNYKILETFEAGIVLSGPEVKSIRAGRVDIDESFAKIQNGEVYLKNAYIYPYFGQLRDYDPKHDRKLLLHKREIENIQGKMTGAPLILVPLKLYTKRNMFKLELGLASSKKKYEKRKAIKDKDEQRRIEQELKGVY